MAESATTLFYGDGCPHCKHLEDFLASHNHPEKMKHVVMREVYHNIENLEALRDTGKSYGIPEEFIGVPFLAIGEKYLMGDSDIIDYFTGSAST